MLQKNALVFQINFLKYPSSNFSETLLPSLALNCARLGQRNFIPAACITKVLRGFSQPVKALHE